MKKIVAYGLFVLSQIFLMVDFFGSWERMFFYWVVVVSLFFLNGVFLVLLITNQKKKDVNKRNNVPIILCLCFIFLVIVGSYYQFNYVVMPYEYFDNDEIFYIDYSYEDLHDTIRIEYYARDYYGEEEIYRISYDKDEIKDFLELFRDIRPISEEENLSLGYQNTNLDWHNDIHVMIRNMDNENGEDSDTGYYVFSIDLVDTSVYAKKVNGSNPAIIYEVPDAFREFIICHLYNE